MMTMTPQEITHMLRGPAWKRYRQRLQWFSGRELAKLLDVTPATISRWRRQGTIPFIKIGQGRGIYRYCLADVLEAKRNG